MIKLTAVIASFLLYLTASLPCAYAAKYKITDLGTLGGPQSEAFAINNKGQVVGQSMNPKGQKRAFLWEKGKMISLGSFGGDWSSATHINDYGTVVCGATLPSEQSSLIVWHAGKLTNIGEDGLKIFSGGINNKGQVTGSVETPKDLWHAFIWDKNKLKDLGAIDGHNTHESGINNAGEIVGSHSYMCDEGRCIRSHIRRSGKVTDLGVLPGMYGCVAMAINDRSQVIGYCYPKLQMERRRGFVWEKGKMKDLGTLGESVCMPIDINSKGQVVGVINMKDRRSFPFLWEKGKMVDLNSLIPQGSGWTLTAATDINDQGQIVGCGIRKDQMHGYILDPKR